MILNSILLLLSVKVCYSYKILAIFPYNGRSHHIYFSSLVEELARRDHNVTVVNCHHIEPRANLRQIVLQDQNDAGVHDSVNMEEHLKFVFSDFIMAYDSAQAFKYIANTNCQKLMKNHEVQHLVKEVEYYDVVIVEQFVTDCALAIAYKLKAPIVGMTAHILMPWTYSRLGASNHPAFVPNHFIGSGTKPNLLNRIKSNIINFGMNMYFRFVIQKSDQEIITEVYPEMPVLENIGKNISLIMLNQYFPLVGPRIYGPNVKEIGGMHIKENNDILDEKLRKFIDASDAGIVYVSFGTVAANFPRKIINEFIKLFENHSMKFIWKTDINDWTPPSNVLIGKWMPQVAVLCHPKVVAFVSHSGMLSTTEAIHCGVPVVGIPLFGDQYANAASAVESGLGISVDIATLDSQSLGGALEQVLQDKYRERAKELSVVWRDRPISPMNAAVYWLEYVARHKGTVDMKPPTVHLPLYQYYMLDLILVYATVLLLILHNLKKVFSLFKNGKQEKKVVQKVKRNKNLKIN